MVIIRHISSRFNIATLWQVVKAENQANRSKPQKDIYPEILKNMITIKGIRKRRPLPAEQGPHQGERRIRTEELIESSV